MIKSILKLLLFLCIGGVVVFAYQAKGHVDIRWENVSVSMKIGTFVLLILLGTWILFYVFLFVNYLGQLAKNLRQYWRDRHELEGHRYTEEAISALAGGLSEVALKKARKGSELLKESLFAQWVYAVAMNEVGSGLDESVIAGLVKSKSFGLAGYRLRIEQLLKQRDQATAVNEVEAAVERYPNAIWLLQTLFKIYVHQGDVQKAMEIAKKLRQLNHSDADAKMALCYVLQSRMETKLEQKLKCLQLAHELDKTNPIVGIELSRLHIEAGRIKKAQQVIETVWKYSRQPELGHVYLETLTGLNSEEMLAGALKLLEISSASTEGYVVIIKVCIHSEFYQKARYYLEKAIQANGGMSYSLFELRIDLAKKDSAEKVDYPLWIKQVAAHKRFEGWECAHCRSVSPQWEAECLRCGEVSSYFWKGEHEHENNFFAIKGV
ncbi:MAG: tetratricopeptide repeat protein [Alphaproteobacteria bacterium]|nr:tetratricopeptide repeat protein [Alphaproteobacteria bacterium]